MENPPNVLAERYASAAMREIWSPRGRVVLEREFWIAVLKAQAELGLEVAPDAIAAYERAKGEVNLDRIHEREARTKHDVKARIDEFCELAGHEAIHRGMTSRDLTENVEQMQIHRSLRLMREKAVAALLRLAERAQEWSSVLLTARTHNVAAQQTTLGKRLAMFGEELDRALQRLDLLIETYPGRGLKGAVGTQLDQITLMGDAAVGELEQKVASHLGLPRLFVNVGQVYPRSLDFEAVSALVQLGAGPASFAKTLRLMAGHELAGEGFLPGQTGSSAMPHKMNSRSCERINGFHAILRGHLAMVDVLAGDQWNEGDVSCSVVRRVALPDACMASDGQFETLLTVLGNMGANEAVIAQERDRYLPFLLTTSVLMAAVKAGGGREQMHEVIKENAVAAAEDLRTGRVDLNDLFERLAADARLPLGETDLAALRESAAGAVGAAKQQVAAFAQNAEAWAMRFPAAREVQPGEIL